MSSLALSAGFVVASALTVGVVGSPPAGATSAASGLTWSALSPPTTPPGLIGAAAAYDASNSTVVAFGGQLAGGQLSTQTWVWNGSTWSEAAVFGASPPARELASMAYDTALSPPQLILFGGRAADGTLLDDTWSWNGSSWNQVATATSPGGREGAAMAADAAGQLVVFGGYGRTTPAASTTTPTTDPASPTSTVPATTTTVPAPTTTTVPPASTTTTSTTTTPTTLSPAPTTTLPAPTTTTGPTGSAGGDQTTSTTTATNPGGGGSAAALTASIATPQVLDDTWVLASSGGGADDWTEVDTPVHPPAATDASMATWPSGQTMLFGGSGAAPGDNQPAGTTNQTWLYSGGTWSHVKTTVAPPSRQDALLAYDAVLGATVLFGGEGATATLSDTWLWNGAAWLRAAPASTPSPRSGAAGAYDAAAGDLVAFGGADDAGAALASTEVLGARAPIVVPASASTTSVPVATTTPAASTTTIGDSSAFGSTVPTSTAPSTTVPPRPVPTKAQSVHRGDIVTLRGSGFLPHVLITITFHSVTTTLSVVRANAEGSFRINVPVPVGAAIGDHHFEASGRGPSGMTNLITPVQVVALAAVDHTSTRTTWILVGIAVTIPALAWAAFNRAGRRRVTFPR